jgi:hypothetical protein
VKSLPKKPLIKKIIRQKQNFWVPTHVKSLPKKNPNSGNKPLIGTKTLPKKKMGAGPTKKNDKKKMGPVRPVTMIRVFFLKGFTVVFDKKN